MLACAIYRINMSSEDPMTTGVNRDSLKHGKLQISCVFGQAGTTFCSSC